MQQRGAGARAALACQLLAALLSCGGAGASRRAASAAGLAQAQARAWLGSHGPQPQQDELTDLKNENPEAYAIVKALLTKRALGLLDPKHPTASFAAPTAQAAGTAVSSVDFAAAQGITGTSQALEQKSATVETAADSYPEAPAPRHAHKDWLSWRPSDSATDDDAQVAQVLGEVAQLKGGAAAGSLAATGQRVAEAAAAPQEPNSYLKGIDFGADARVASQRPQSAENPYLKATGLVASAQQVAPARAAAAPAGAAAAPPEAPAPAAQQNSYLKDIGLAEAKHAVSQEAGDRNLLTSFSWSDDDDSRAHRTQALRQPPDAGAVPQVPQVVKKNALMAWLGSTWSSKIAAEPSRPVSQAPAAKPTEAPPQGHYNVYLKDLQ